ncbi:MAG: tRNA (N(6)-L-threonylcarbamoyladenosine(37)-C(2))-methylthiotransferase MtaB [Desulfonatronovibrionaceae bacterium]
MTMGCKINQYESQSLTQGMLNRGFSLVCDPASAQTVIINSCAVTSRAVRDLKKTCRYLARTCPHSRILITGCAAQVFRPELEKLPQVWKVIPQQDKTQLHLGPDSLWDPATAPGYGISDYFRSRAVVKIQDGCSHRCTYCIVPSTRGQSKSRTPEAILAEIKRLMENRFTEIILCGINTRLYGKDLSPSMDLFELIQFLRRFLNADKSRLRLRLSSLEPSQLDSRALNILTRDRLICPHLHISLQSGSPAVLKRMNRKHYTPEQLTSFIRHLKQSWPVFGLGVDIIAGFPGETAQDHQKTMDLLDKLPIAYAHVFPYSPRPGTPAARFSSQVPSALKQERAAQLRAPAREKKAAFLQKLLCLPVLEVVMENMDKAVSEYYAECIVHSSKPLAPRQNLQVRPSGLENSRLICRPA